MPPKAVRPGCPYRGPVSLTGFFPGSQPQSCRRPRVLGGGGFPGSKIQGSFQGESKWLDTLVAPGHFAAEHRVGEEAAVFR
jgi:hypothetical protein